MSARVIHGDCLDVMPTLGLSGVDAIVTDPPYGLSFMGKAWDRGVPGPMYWSQALRVVRPGGYLLSFGGTRTFHRLTCAIEDGGWEIHDCISWLYGSGFPKHRSKLKPAWEPIILARRPAATATPLNIDACRLDSGERALRVPAGRTGAIYGAGLEGGLAAGTTEQGRWPANVILDEESAALLDEQTGELSAGNHPALRRGIGFTENGGGSNAGTSGDRRGTDSGGASRFYYCAKTSRSERDAGLTGERKALNWSSGTQSPGTFQSAGTDKTARNHHPTVKPLSLMRWLCRLVTPSGGLILDPFCGSGSTGCAAALEGFRFLGIELDAEYVAIADARIAHHATLAGAA